LLESLDSCICLSHHPLVDCLDGIICSQDRLDFEVGFVLLSLRDLVAEGGEGDGIKGGANLLPEVPLIILRGLELLGLLLYYWDGIGKSLMKEKQSSQ
jgi:hypothetical protein